MQQQATDNEQFLEQFDVRAASTAQMRRRNRSESVHDPAPAPKHAHASSAAATHNPPPRGRASHRRLPEQSPAPICPTESRVDTSSSDEDEYTPPRLHTDPAARAASSSQRHSTASSNSNQFALFSGHPSASRYRVSEAGEIRSLRTGRSPSVQKWEFYTYDKQWATRGLPYSDDLLPTGVQYICGQPERNTTTDSAGVPRQHFQGFVAFALPCTRSDLQTTLKLNNFGAVPVGNSMVQARIAYTKKAESAVRGENGESLWKEAGKLEDNLKRRGDKHTEIVECIKNGGTEMDVLEMHPQMGIQFLGNISRMVGLYSKPVDRPDLQVYLIFGKTRVGKSHFIRRILQDGDNTPVFNKPHPASPTSTDFWPLNYNGATRVLLDDWHPKKYNITDMLNYMQEYAMSVQVKGGYVAAKWNRIYITTNVPIETWYDHLPESFSGNIEALKARIPEANRMIMRRRPPPEMTSCTFAEMKRYQDQFAADDQAPANNAPVTVDLGALSLEELRALIQRAVAKGQVQ